MPASTTTGTRAFSMMRRMTEEMGRMLDEFGGMQSETEQSIWSPAIEVAERDGKCVIHAELPGVKPDDVKVELLDDSLIIQGERKFEHQENQGGVQRTERHYGQFYRATDTKSLEQIFNDIDKFEKTTVSVKKYQQYRDLFPACIAAGLSLLVAQLLLAQTVWKKLP